MPTTDALDARIRELVAELMASTPQAPVLPGLEWAEAGQLDARSGAPADTPGATPAGTHHRPGRRRRVSMLVAGVSTTVVAVLVVVLVLPTAGRRPPAAAAAALRQLATTAASGSLPQLGSGQWLLTHDSVSFSANVGQVGASSTPGAQATMHADIEEWSDGNGDACTSASFDPAQFASPANRAAWTAAGLLVDPTDQLTLGCITVSATTPHNDFDGGSGVIDVSGLSTDPSTLARQLMEGTTGMAALDRLGPGQQPDAGFERAAIVLVGPTSGETPAFLAALYQALAMIPGIDALGNVVTHGGVTGLGFAGSTAPGSAAIVVDPTTGALLEAHNIPTPVAFNGLIRAYQTPTPTGSLGTEGGVYGTAIEWLDPVGSPTVVGVGSLPRGFQIPQQLALTGSIIATAKPDVAFADLLDLKATLATRYGAPTSSGYTASVATEADPGATTTTSPAQGPVAAGFVLAFTFSGPRAQLDEYAAALKASALFSSVQVHDTAP